MPVVAPETPATQGRGSMYSLRISSGVLAATSSISMPPDAEAINTGLAGLPIDNNAKVEFLADIKTFLDQNLLNHASFRPGLRVTRFIPSIRPCDLRRFVRRLSDFTPPPFPRPPA